MKRLVLLLTLFALVVAACGETMPTDPRGTGLEGSVTALRRCRSIPIPIEPDLPIGGPYPVADVSVTIEHPDADTVQYRIVCLGDTATVMGDPTIDAPAACLALGDPIVQQRLFEGAPLDQVCTEIYGGPDIATVSGTIDDFEFEAVIDRTNGCGISDWDQLLGDILPIAIGVTE